jgi:hypothetical protein
MAIHIARREVIVAVGAGSVARDHARSPPFSSQPTGRSVMPEVVTERLETNRSRFLGNQERKETAMNQEEQAKKMSQLIAKCWADEGFKRKILADPAATLRAEGVELPAGLSYVAHENTEKVVHLIIPAKPTEMSDEDLAHVAGGTCFVHQAQFASSNQQSSQCGIWCSLCQCNSF